MKTTFSILLIATLFLFQNCTKPNETPDPVTPINCNGLVTDTLGTNDNGKIFMPNAFTPNGDGNNDIIRPVTFNVASIVFTIYDEANNIVFTTNQLAQGWAPITGTNVALKYYYKIQVITNANHKIGKCGELYRLTCRPANLPMASLYFEDMLTVNGFTGVTSEALSTCP
jgi:gliding motility-associated-like protein